MRQAHGMHAGFHEGQEFCAYQTICYSRWGVMMQGIDTVATLAAS